MQHLTAHELKIARKLQQTEITEFEVYTSLAKRISDPKYKRILLDIAQEERCHADFWEQYTEQKLGSYKLRVIFHNLITRLFGFTFVVRLMEKGEKQAQINYTHIAKTVPEALDIIKDERSHEDRLIGLLDGVKLKYIGSMVLGVNDALVELTGALVGLTLVLQKTPLIALTGLVTGVAAALSMAASEYLSLKAEQGKDPLRAASLTGVVYMMTVFILVSPFFIFQNAYVALGFTLLNSVVVVFFFTFYISVAQGLPFLRRFVEMVGISLGVSFVTSIIGYIIRASLNAQI